MAVGMIDKVRMERKEVVHQMKLEFLDVLLLPLSRGKFFPCLQEILHPAIFSKFPANCIFMNTDSHATPPPTQ